jgi:hypothetical protein
MIYKQLYIFINGFTRRRTCDYSEYIRKNHYAKARLKSPFT